MSSADISQQFRTAMRQVPATVSILTCAEGAEWAGMTVTAVSSLSMEPPALLACVHQRSSIFPLLSRAGTFCVNVLETTQQSLAGHFAGRSRQGGSRFAHGGWQLSIEGAPVLKGAATNIVCRRVSVQPFGTHAVFIGTVCSVFINNDAAPTLYYRGGYGRFAAEDGGETHLPKAS